MSQLRLIAGTAWKCAMLVWETMTSVVLHLTFLVSLSVPNTKIVSKFMQFFYDLNLESKVIRKIIRPGRIYITFFESYIISCKITLVESYGSSGVGSCIILLNHA
jgi:hypothetical protein